MRTTKKACITAGFFFWLVNSVISLGLSKAAFVVSILTAYDFKGRCLLLFKDYNEKFIIAL